MVAVLEIIDDINLRIALVRHQRNLFTFVKQLIAKARKEALEEAVKIAEKRAHELLNLYTMHNGEHDVRGGVAAGEVGLLIQEVINRENPTT